LVAGIAHSIGLDQHPSRLRAARYAHGKVKAWAKALFGPRSSPGNPRMTNAPGSETGPGPQLVTWGKSTILSVDAHGFKFEYTANSAKHIPFDWSGPAPYHPA